LVFGQFLVNKGGFMLNKEKPVEVLVSKEKCTKCGICIESCSDYLKKDANGYPAPKSAEETLLGCIQCGSCMMKCPNSAIEIIGEDIDKDHLCPMPKRIADYEALNSLLLKRRSIRKFKPEDVSEEDINKILSSAVTAPVGIAPSEVKVMVFCGRKKVQEFAQDLCLEIENMLKIITPFTLKLIKTFKGVEQYKMMKDFVIQLCKATLDEKQKGNDILFYDAPSVVLFYGTQLCSVEDMVIASTNAIIAAESLNLGTCFIGSVPHLVNNSSKLKKKYGILKGEKAGIAFILGYPNDGKYLRVFKRNFKEVKLLK
jgi:nitroreductase/NAD-dependent dihydropyrimidine dehydrogenase PreA subunit